MAKRNLLHCFGSRHGAQIDFRKFGQGEHLQALSRKHHHCGRRMLLQPSFIDKEASGIHNASSQIIMKCDADTCKDLRDSGVLYDAVAVFQGIGEHTAKACNVR